MPEFYMILARKMPEFFIIIARKIFFSRILGGEGTCPPCPVSYAYGQYMSSFREIPPSSD